MSELGRNFWLLWVNRVLTRVAYNIIFFTLMIWVFQLTSSNAAVSLYMVMYFIASVSFALVAGVAADHFDRRKIMVLASIAWGAVVLLFIPAKESFPIILLITLVTQALDEFFNPSQGASLPQLVEGENLLSANSVFYMATYGSTFVGFFLSGVLLRFFGYEWPFIIAAVLVLLGAIFSFSLPSLGNGDSLSSREFFVQVKRKLLDQWEFLMRNREVASTVILMAVVIAGSNSAGALAPGFAEQVLKIDARDLSFFAVIPLGIGLVLGATILNRFGRLWEVWHSVLGFGVTLLLLSGTPALRVFFSNHVTTPQAFEHIPTFSLIVGGLVFFLGLFASTVAIPVVTSLHKITPSHNLGRTLGSLATLVAVLTSFMTLIFGNLADFTTPLVPMVLVGVFAAGASFWIKGNLKIR